MVKKKSKEKITPKEKIDPKKTINCWMIVSIILAILLMINGLIAITSGISKKTAERKFLEFAQARGADVEVTEVSSIGDIYKITFNLAGQVGEFHMTKDGKYIGQMVEFSSVSGSTGGSSPKVPTQTISECASEKDVSENTVIFYYSDSCGWCARMKPGVASLVDRGYNVISANAAERNPVIDECVIPHMESGGVPQFICVKTGEIKVGAFVDSDGNLDQAAMDAWVKGCLSN